MYSVPALVIETLHLTTHNEKRPTEIVPGEYALTFRGYTESYDRLNMRLKGGTPLYGVMWLDGQQHKGLVMSVTQRDVSWIVRFRLLQPIDQTGS